MREINKIRVLIVDDSILFREVLNKALSSDAHIEIVGSAIDSYDALEKIRALNPDVVTMDVEMPKMNGIDFLKTLIPEHPLPVVVVSALPINALDALNAGAVDFVKKPLIRNSSDLNLFINELLVKIKIASTAKIRRNSISATLPVARLVNASNDMICAIGASTGGTEAILEVIKNLPATSPGIVIVQHMPPVFTKMYAQRLDKICKVRVKEAQHLDRVVQGQAILAAGEYHMRLAKDREGYYIKSEPGAKVSGHCPSVDVLFDTVAETAGSKAIGVLLTGMGADGAQGLLKMRQKGSFTIGQDKDSSVVYGMPMVAWNIGAVIKQLPLSRISDEIIRHLNQYGR